jgi:hypothetical protein
MSKIMPLFASAPRLKLYIDQEGADATTTTSYALAYAVGFTIAVSVDVQPVYVIGQYEPVALEPTMVNVVTGTFQIVRLVKNTLKTQADSESLNSKLHGGAPATDKQDAVDAVTASTVGDPSNQSLLFKHVDPAQLLLSKTFNIRVFMKVPTSAAKLDEKPWMVIRDCRITSRNTNIAMGQLVNTPLSFRGLLLSDLDASGNAVFSSDNAITSG